MIRCNNERASAALCDKLDAARNLLYGLDSATVLFSGGADSSLAAILAVQALGNAARAVTLHTEFTSAHALDLARRSARAAGIDHRVVRLRLLEDDRVVANKGERCYLCKKRMALAAPGAVLLDGTNADDDPGRPGMAATAERGVVSPLRLAGIRKAEVRQALRMFGHPAADEPSDSCLATRIKGGEPITPERLAAVERLEEAVRTLGRPDVRARITRGGGRLETPGPELDNHQKQALTDLANGLGVAPLDFHTWT